MQRYNGQLINQFANVINGNAAAGAQVTVRLKSTGATVTLYATDDIGGATLANPLTANAKGYYGFYAPDGIYTLDVNISGTPQLEIPLQDIAALQAQFDAALANAGYIPVGTFAAGCTVSQSNGVVSDGSSYWRWDGALPKTVTAGSAPTPVGADSWILISDSGLRGDLAGADSNTSISGVTAKSVAIHVQQSRRNISHYISRAQLDDALTGNPQLDTTAGWNNALQDTTITALDFKGGYKVSGTGAACITQTANVSLFGNSRRDSFIRADAAGAFTSIISLQIATNGGLGDVRGWQAKDFVIFHNGGGGSCITNDGGLPMLECAFKNIGFQAGSTPGVRDLLMTRFAFSKVEQCSFGSGVTCGLTAYPSPDGNKFLLNNFFGIPTSLILELESGAYRTEVYGGTMVSRDGGVRILKGSQIAIRGVQFEQFQPYGPNVSPESAHIAIVGSASQVSDSIIIEGNNFGGGTNLQNLIYTDYASNVDITKNFMNSPNPTGFDVLITANSKYIKPRTDNVIQGNISNPRPQNVRFPMVVSDAGVGTYNVLKEQTTLLNGWTGGQFYKDETDKVIINTGFNSGSLAVSTAICTMPEGFKPADFYALPAVSTAGFCVVNTNPTTGQLIVGSNSTGSNSEFASNLTFASRRGA